jgi:hypothetical protein
MFGISFKAILRSFLAEGPLKKPKKNPQPPPLPDTYDASGLSSIITIRPVVADPFVPLDNREYSIFP